MQKIQYIPPEPSLLAIVGEAPGTEEQTYRIPFIGKEGQYYQRRVLKPAGINYDAKTYGKRVWNAKLNRKVFVQRAKVSGNVYVTNTVHKKPPKNVYEALSLKDRQEGRDQLKEDLESWKSQGLKVVLAVGAKALEALTGYTKISALRGTVLPCTLVPDLKVVATLHPGNLFRGNHVMEPIVKIDHEYAIEETKHEGIRYPERNVHIFKDYSEAIALLEQYTDVENLTAVDIETNSKELMVAFGWAASPSRAYVIPKEFLKIPSVLRAVSRFCASSTPKLYHKVLFDVFFLAYYYAIVNRNFSCSLIAFHSVYPTLPKSLGFIASIYTHEPYWKCIKGDCEVLTPNGWKKIEDIDYTETIMTSSIDGSLSFSNIEKVEYNFTGDGIKIENLRHSCWYTKDHKIPNSSVHKDNMRINKVKDLQRCNILSSGYYLQGKEDYNYIKLLVAIQADASVRWDRNKEVYFNLEKERKIDRLYKICSELNVEIKPFNQYRDRLECQVKGPLVESIVELLGPRKDFGPWLLSYNSKTLNVFLSELTLWDGWITYGGKALNYSSNNYNNIKWVSTIAHLCGYTAHIMDAAGSKWNCKKVSMKKTNFISVKKQHLYKEHHTGKIYCVRTDDGFFLCRSGEHIFITGNSEGKDAIEDIKQGREIDWTNFYIYNGKDCCLTYEIWSSIKADMKDWDVEGIFNFMMDLTDPCLYAMLKGIAYDSEADQGYAKKNEKAIKMMETIVNTAVCPGLNAKSPKQLKELIYDNWDMPKQYKQGRLTTEEKKLHKLETFGTPYKLKIGAIRVCKKLYKDREFYNLNLDKDERIRTEIRPFGTYTGRFSTRKSVTGSGRNFQNIPKQLRKAYIPDEGKVFLPCDLSQSEARIVAALCRDQEWLTSFDSEDQHTKVASMIYNIPKEKVEKATHRQIAKRVAHASHYLLGPGLLSEIVGCTIKEAKDLKARYFAFRSSLPGWHEEVRQIVYKKKYIKTVFGRVIQFFGPATDEVIREAIAAEPQSTSADYLNHGIKAFNENLPKEYEFLIQVHDSILPQVPDDLDFIKWIIPEMQRLMHKEITIKGLTFSVPLDMSIAFSFGGEVEIKGSIDDAYHEAKEKHEKSKQENKLLLDKLT